MTRKTVLQIVGTLVGLILIVVGARSHETGATLVGIGIFVAAIWPWRSDDISGL